MTDGSSTEYPHILAFEGDSKVCFFEGVTVNTKRTKGKEWDVTPKRFIQKLKE